MLNVFKEMRLQVGYTQLEAANIIGVVTQTISRWERMENVTKWNKKQYVLLFALKAKMVERELRCGEYMNVTQVIDFMQIDLRDFYYSIANNQYEYI
jgi:DNA-binding XRE family transcriptional regulator